MGVRGNTMPNEEQTITISAVPDFFTVPATGTASQQKHDLREWTYQVSAVGVLRLVSIQFLNASGGYLDCEVGPVFQIRIEWSLAVAFDVARLVLRHHAFRLNRVTHTPITDVEVSNGDKTITLTCENTWPVSEYGVLVLHLYPGSASIASGQKSEFIERTHFTGRVILS
eukprot:jgi/Mesvir1/17675/Mv06214-RA.1